MDVPEDFYTKYSWAVSSDADLVHGATGTNNALGVASPEEKGRSVGVFLIQPSHEYLNGGARALSLVGCGGGGEREGGGMVHHCRGRGRGRGRNVAAWQVHRMLRLPHIKIRSQHAFSFMGPARTTTSTRQWPHWGGES